MPVSFQVRFSEQLHGELEAYAKKKEVSIADVLRKATEIYLALEGKELFMRDEAGELLKLLIPGHTKR